MTDNQQTPQSNVAGAMKRFFAIAVGGSAVGGAAVLAFGLATGAMQPLSANDKPAPTIERTDLIAQGIVNAMSDDVKRCAAKEFSTLQKHGVEIDGKKLMSVIKHCKR